MPEHDIRRIQKFSEIMHELGVHYMERACMYLAFAVHVQIKEGEAEVNLEYLYKRVANRHNVSKETVEAEIWKLEREVFERFTGVRALVNPKSKEIVEKYFCGNEGLIQDPKRFLTCIIKSIKD
ncbi:MAG: hypothetical protein HFJ50_05505 [Clostridia bacterium]|jgi:hypothetical protein|nr:hypothetical protein [Clostridia bacterium]